MDDTEARRIIETEIAPALGLFSSRKSATLDELSLILARLNPAVEKLPRDISWPEDFEFILKATDLRRTVKFQWPELGFYDDTNGSEFLERVPESIGDAADDLSDISLDLARGIEISSVDAVGALSQIRFWYDTHWGKHSTDLQRYLSQKLSS
ncbi:hypothetical protein [Deinococcus altitudinis]|uniref:hypothetical protein n=1 Tax=Deinococcus altitudinis TaxID=468914 RepID=UPI003891CF2F